VSALLLLAAALAAGPAALPGDVKNGAALYRIECSGCHGTDLRGSGPMAKGLKAAPDNLRDAGALLSLGDAEMAKAISEGVVSMHDMLLMPGFGHGLSPLDLADLVAFLRSGVTGLRDVYPEANRFTGKRYEIDAEGLKRFETIVGEKMEQPKVMAFSAYKGGVAGEPPEFITPEDNRGLDTLKKKEKVGYLVFVTLPVGVKGASMQVALGVADNGTITALLAANPDDPARADAEKRLKPFVGMSGAERKPFVPPKGVKGEEALAKALTRAYYRAQEGIGAAKKDEYSRTWAD
jgi:mono/diheme cytochrome c family protein